MLRVQHSVLVLLGLILFVQPLQAQLFQLPLADIAGHSTLIVEGRVIARQSFWDNRHHNIYTANTVEVSAILKGAATAPETVQVITRGGIVGDRMHIVSESVQYETGDAGMFCLFPAPMDIPVAPAWENYGSPHGFFRYDFPTLSVQHPFHPFAGIGELREKIKLLTREPVVTIPGKELHPVISDRATPVITMFSPTTTTAGMGNILTINGSNFGASPGLVRFVNGDTGGIFSADVADIISWSDTEIMIEVPSTSSSGGVAATGTIQVRNSTNETGTSSGTLTIDFAYTNITYNGDKYGAKLAERNGAGGLTFTMSTSICNGGDQDAANALGRALREWRCATGVNWAFSTTATAGSAIADDGTNMVTWDVSTPLSGGTLGQTTSRISGCFSGPNDDVYWYVNEIDVNLDEATNWYFCDNGAGIPFSSYDFQSVVFHELGHGHQLAHLNNSAAVMHRSISNNQVKRTLNAAELAGATFIINQSANPCGPGPMTLLGSPACLAIVQPTDCDNAGVCTASLPVELIHFHGTAVEAGARLDWSTATEHNNDYFTLERSADAIAFVPLVKIPGELHSTSLKQYEYLDRQPLPGLNYYRLRQTDHDGKETALATVAVRFGKEAPSVRLYPNPAAGDRIFISAENLDSGESLDWVITDLAGRQLMQQEVEIGQQGTPQSFLLTALAPGAYLLRVYHSADRRLIGQELLIRQ